MLYLSPQASAAHQPAELAYIVAQFQSQHPQAISWLDVARKSPGPATAEPIPVKALAALLAQLRLPHSAPKIMAAALAAREFCQDTLARQTSCYIEPGDDDTLLPMQIYRDQTIYIHTLHRDTKGAKGGYKHFSRSINLNSGRLVANLVLTPTSMGKLKKFLREVRIMRLFRASRLVLSYQHLDLVKGATGLQLMMQTKLYDYDLGTWLKRPRSLAQKLQFARKSILALELLHRKGYIHRDIKPGNFFVRHRRDDQLEVVLADFGLAEHHTQNGFGKHISGTRGYIAPELCLARGITGIAIFNSLEGIKSDLFSLGLTWHRLMFGKDTRPKRAITAVNLKGFPRDRKLPLEVPDIAAEVVTYERLYEDDLAHLTGFAREGEAASADRFVALIYQMIHPDPLKRPSTAEVIQALNDLRPENE